MNYAKVLNRARASGLRLSVDGANLVWRSTAPVRPAVIDFLRAHKAEIIAEITAPSIASQGAAEAVGDWRDWYEQRVVIRQFDRRYTRDEAGRTPGTE